MRGRGRLWGAAACALIVASVVLPTAHADVAEGEGARAWAPIDEARIRPGVKLYLEGKGYCTSNFVFLGHGSREGKVYLGTAGHCADRDIGLPVRLPEDHAYATRANGPVIGHIAYSSFVTLGIDSYSCYVLLSCSDEGIDFALVEIDESWVDEVHPSMLRFGGPTATVPFDEVEVGDKVLTYGNSVARPGPSILDEHEGYVVGKQPPYKIMGHTVLPGIPGDSGSGVLLGDGRALGVLVTLEWEPPGSNGIVSLEKALSLAQADGWDVELATSETLEPGILPSVSG